jgi:uncharacterized protein YprB with RNaseH-like and TPR domain
MLGIKDLFCVHRHDIESHPSCFANGLVNDKQANKIAKEMGVEWYQIPQYRIGYLDIETDNLKADLGTMLSWSIKEKDGTTAYDIIDKKELFNGTFDTRIIKSCINEMCKYKIIVTYFGTGFDLPFLRTKALHYDFDFPAYGDIYNFDLYYTVKSKLCLSRKSLAVATQYLGIEGKTPLDGNVWYLAKYGDKKALNSVLYHNIADVEILESLHNKLQPFRKWVRTSI